MKQEAMITALAAARDALGYAIQRLAEPAENPVDGAAQVWDVCDAIQAARDAIQRALTS
jgi:hypothetical protein